MFNLKRLYAQTPAAGPRRGSLPAGEAGQEALRPAPTALALIRGGDTRQEAAPATGGVVQPAAPAPPLTAELKKQDLDALLADLVLHLRNDKLNLRASAILQGFDRTLKQFARQVHGSKLFARDAHAQHRLGTEEFLAQRASFLDQQKNIRSGADRAMDLLFDALFATDMRELTAGFKAFLPKKFGESWRRIGVSEDKRRDIGKKIINDLFTLNRNLLTNTGESLIALIKRQYQEGDAEAGREYLAGQIKRAFVNQADCLRVTRALAAYIEYHIDILRSGPAIHAPGAAELDERAYIEERAARVRRQFDLADAAADAGAIGNSRTPGEALAIALPDADAAWRAGLESRLFRRGTALMLPKPIELLSGSERIMIRCAGQGEYQEPYLTFHQLNSESLAMAMSVFLLKGFYNFKVRPLDLSLFQAFERDYWQRQNRQTPPAPAERERAAIDILAALDAQQTVVTPDLLRHIAQAVDPDPAHPEAETGQAAHYLRLLGKPVFSILLKGGRDLVAGPDWEIQQALIDATGGSTQRILVHQGHRSGGHFHTWLRSSATRAWNKNDSLPGNQSPFSGTPGKSISHAFQHGQTQQMELFYIDAPDNEPARRDIDESLRFYQEVLGQARYGQAVGALGEFLGTRVGKWAFYQFLAGAGAHASGEVAPVSMGYAHRQAAAAVSLKDMANFLNSLDGGGVAEHLRFDWPGGQMDPLAGPDRDGATGAGVSALEQRLNKMRGCRSVVLSGWDGDPYYIVASKGLDKRWYVGTGQDHKPGSAQQRKPLQVGRAGQRSLARFFEDLELPAGKRLADTPLNILRLAPAHRTGSAREHLIEVVDTAVRDLNGRILAHLEDEEASLQMEAEFLRAMEEDENPAQEEGGEDDHDSLFGSPLSPHRSPTPSDTGEDGDGPTLAEFYSRSAAENTRARNITALLARALDGGHVEPEAGPSSAPARQFQRKALTHVTSAAVQDRLVLTRHNLIPMIASGRVSVRIGEAAGDAILARMSGSAVPDQRFARFLDGDDAAQNREALNSALLEAISQRQARRAISIS